MDNKNPHSADAAALGFLYQAQYALLRLWNETSDDAVVFLETLDDVVLKVNGETILEQLKHSLSEKPPAITLASLNLWKTLKAWIDVLSELDLSRTWLHLVAVAEISPTSPLQVLVTEDESRESLVLALQEEARRVVRERTEAEAKGETPLPHAQRAAACEAFLKLSDELQGEILSRARIKPGQKNIAQLEDELAGALTTVLAKDRAHVAAIMVEWWNRQIVHAHCGKRDKAIRRFELVKRHMEIVGDIENDALIDYFATGIPPESYRSHPMVANQINLVGGTNAELRRAITNEWRARETRSRWTNENPLRRELIASYDDRLTEEWSDRHIDMCDECDGHSEDAKKEEGRKLLKWSHYQAPNDLESIAQSITTPSYVRGSYQVLSISGRVGWHPDYRTLLELEE